MCVGTPALSPELILDFFEMEVECLKQEGTSHFSSDLLKICEKGQRVSGMF